MTFFSHQYEYREENIFLAEHHTCFSQRVSFEEIFEDSWLAFVLTALTHVGVNMVLLHKRECECCHISADPITVCVWSCIWFVDATLRKRLSIFSEGKSKHTYLIFMWKLNIHQNILFLMLLYSSKKLHRKPSQKGKVKSYVWPVLEICRLILFSKWNGNWSWHISLPMK